MAAFVAAALLVTGCGGPFGVRVGFNPETIAAMKDDHAATCIVLESSAAGGLRVVWWRDPRPTAAPASASARECLDPRSIGPVP